MKLLDSVLLLPNGDIFVNTKQIAFCINRIWVPTSLKSYEPFGWTLILRIIGLLCFHWIEGLVDLRSMSGSKNYVTVFFIYLFVIY
jgi:hypothetical protein